MIASSSSFQPTLKRGSSAQPREYSPLMTPSSMRSSMITSTTACGRNRARRARVGSR